MTVTNALRRLVARTPSNAESFFLPLLAQANVRQEETLFSELIVAVRELQLTRMAVEETLLQCCLFDGYPAALEGFRRLNRFWPANTGELREEYSARQLAEWRRRGAALCQLIYGESTDKLITDVQALSPDLSSWFLVEGYGRVLSRPGLSIQVRELITIAILLWKGYPRQLRSHLRGAMRVGVAAEVVCEILQLAEADNLELREEALLWCRKYSENEQVVAGKDGSA